MIRRERESLGAVGHWQELPAPGQYRGADVARHRRVDSRTADCTWSQGGEPGPDGLWCISCCYRVGCVRDVRIGLWGQLTDRYYRAVRGDDLRLETGR